MIRSFFNNTPYKLLIILWAIYILIFGLISNSYSISFKYFMYLSIFVMILNYDNLSEIGLLGKYYNCVFFSFCLMILSQYFLYLINSDIVYDGPTIERVADYIFRTDATYKSPLYFGLIRVPEGLVKYGDFTFFRHLSYTTEPKYASCLFLTLLISILINKKRDIYFKPMILVTLIVMFFIHSFSGFAVIIITGMIYFTRKLFKFGYKKIILLFLFGNTISILIISYILDFYNVPEFVYNRIYNHEESWFSGAQTPYSLQVILGTARYGIIGRIFEWINFSLFIYFSDKYFLRKNKIFYYEIAVLLAFSTYYVFWITILPEIITPLLLFIIISIYYLSVREENYQKFKINY